MSDNITPEQLRSYRSLNEYGETVRHEICDKAADTIERLTKERDEALDRVEELEAEGERVSTEFEGDLWKEVRSLLADCSFDWSDVDWEGVTADQAASHIRETLKEETRRAERAEKERDEARASAAGVLLDQWLFGAFEDTADAAADDAITQQWAHVDRTYPDAAPIIEAWLRALIDKPDAANG